MDDCHSPGGARIFIAAEAWRHVLTDPEGVVARAVEATLAAAAADAGTGATLDVLLADDARLRELNRTWRGSDRATNVLSFPADPGLPVPPGEPRHLGDVAIAAETVVSEAAEAGRSVADHLAHMVVHGVLHLLGHDHQDDVQAARMERLEVRILEGLGVADPYAAEHAA